MGSALNIVTALSVHDYEAAYNYDYNSGTEALNVYGTFTPGASHNYFYGCTMQNGSTIDLSARTTPLPRVSSFTSGQNRLEFAADATVNVEIGARSSDVGTCLVSWPSGSAPDLSVGFALVANGAAVEGKALAVKDDGLYIKAAGEPEYAMWVNDGWQFYTSGVQDTEWGGNVTGNMQVRFTTAAEYDAICAVTPAVSPAAFVLATNKFTNAAGATFDFTRTESLVVGDGTVFDANGGLLKLPAALAGGVNAFTVTNSAEQVGSLEVEVPQDATTTSTKMALTGNEEGPPDIHGRHAGRGGDVEVRGRARLLALGRKRNNGCQRAARHSRCRGDARPQRVWRFRLHDGGVQWRHGEGDHGALQLCKEP